jgi:hypothetical protein
MTRQAIFSQGKWLGLGIGFISAIAFSLATERSTMLGDSAIGAGSELAEDRVDQQRVNWIQMGLSAKLNAATTLAGFGLGRFGPVTSLFVPRQVWVCLHSPLTLSGFLTGVRKMEILKAHGTERDAFTHPKSKKLVN